MLKKLKKLLNWGNRVKPEVDLTPNLYTQLSHFRLPLILIQVFFLIGTLGYLTLEDYSLMQAFFQTAYTLTNTGFGSLSEDKFGTASIIFSTFIMLGGSGIIFFSMAIMINIINNGTLKRLIKEKIMIDKIARLKKHYVVCYHNEYTIELSKQFREGHIPFVVVDNSPDFEEIAKKYKYPYYVKGDPHTDISLLKSHLSSAKGVVTFSKIPADNIALIVSVRIFEKDLKRTPYHIIASADTQEDIDRLKKLGTDSVVSPTKLLAQRVSAMAVKPNMENLLEQFVYKRDTPIDLEEFIIPKRSWIVLKKLKEAHLRDVSGVSVISIIHKDGRHITMPTGDDIITSESKLLMIGMQNKILDVKRLLRKRDKPEELKYI